MMKVSVIVCSYRRQTYLLDTVRALLEQRYDDFEIVVGDQNAEWPGEIEPDRFELSRHPRVKWIHLEPAGVIDARHTAIQHSTGEILLFVDDDVLIPDHQFIAKHVRNYSDPTIAAVSGREVYLRGEDLADRSRECMVDSYPPDTTVWDRVPLPEQPFRVDRDRPYQSKACTFSTCNGSVRRSAFLKVGGFDEQFGRASYGDDYDFAIRLAKAGEQLIYDPAPWLVHLQVPMGGLRFSDKENRTTEKDKAVAPLIFFLRYYSEFEHKRILYNHLLRKTLLRKENVMKPWRAIIGVTGLIEALPSAVRASRQGCQSRFTLASGKSSH